MVCSQILLVGICGLHVELDIASLNGPVAKSLNKWLVGTVFVSWYRLQPRTGL